MSATTHASPQPVEMPEQPSLQRVPGEPKRPIWKIGALVAILAAAALGAYLFWLKPQQAAKATPVVVIRTATAFTGTLEQTARVSGQTAAKRYASITVPRFQGPDSRQDLTLQKMAAPGTWVKQGAVIAELDPTNLRDHLDDVRDGVEQAVANIRKRRFEQDVEMSDLQQTIRVARSQMEKDQLDAKAAEVKTVIERELLKLSAEESAAKYKQLLLDLPQKQIVHKAEIQILEVARTSQDNHLERHVNDFAKFTMRAPMEGLIVSQQIFRSGQMAQIQEGDRVEPGMPFLKIVDTKQMQLEGVINQSAASRFRLGQVATVGLDAFPDLRLKGKVSSIGALATGGRGSSFYIRTVPIRISIEGSDPRLLPDLSAWANVRMQAAENAVIAPRDAIYSDGGQTVVYVRNKTGFEKRPVKLGLANETHAAVISGLRAGEAVALSRPF